MLRGTVAHQYTRICQTETQNPPSPLHGCARYFKCPPCLELQHTLSDKRGVPLTSTRSRLQELSCVRIDNVLSFRFVRMRLLFVLLDFALHGFALFYAFTFVTTLPVLFLTFSRAVRHRGTPGALRHTSRLVTPHTSCGSLGELLQEVCERYRARLLPIRELAVQRSQLLSCNYTPRKATTPH